METINSKTVFIEYSSARHGQHFMTVVQTMNHDRIIVGRIYREYKQETKKTFYKAYDFNGEQIFGDGLDLSDLKNKFKKNGRFMAGVVIANRRVQRQPVLKIPGESKAVRIQTMNEIRGKKIAKEGAKKEDPSKTSQNDRNKLRQDERVQDEKNLVQYKDIGHIIEKEAVAEYSQDKGDSLEADHSNDQVNDHEMSERDMELEDIRADQEDREQDLELEI